MTLVLLIFSPVNAKFIFQKISIWGVLKSTVWCVDFKNSFWYSRERARQKFAKFCKFCQFCMPVLLVENAVVRGKSDEGARWTTMWRDEHSNRSSGSRTESSALSTTSRRFFAFWIFLAFWTIWVNCGFWQRFMPPKTITDGPLLSLKKRSP